MLVRTPLHCNNSDCVSILQCIVISFVGWPSLTVGSESFGTCSSIDKWQGCGGQYYTQVIVPMLVLTLLKCARINDVTGMIILCRGSEVSLWTLNGDWILEQNVYVEGDDTISSCAFYEGSGNEYLERELIFTGHRKGVVNV